MGSANATGNTAFSNALDPNRTQFGLPCTPQFVHETIQNRCCVTCRREGVGLDLLLLSVMDLETSSYALVDERQLVLGFRLQ